MIITTIDQVKAVLTNLYAEIEYADLKTYLESAEHWISEDILGSTIYNNIEDGTITDAKLLRLVNNVIILKGYSEGIPFMDLVQTASGFGVVSDKNHTPASQQRVQRLIDQVKLRLNEQTEWLFNYLEDTATYHDDWKSSPAFSLLTDCLIRTARELKRFVGFEGSRSDFLLRKPDLITKTDTLISRMISKDYVAELISKQNAGTLAAADSKILPGLKQALANLTMGNENFGKQLLADVVTIMDNDIDNYPTYADSDEKADRDTVGFENSEDDPIFVSKTF